MTTLMNMRAPQRMPGVKVRTLHLDLSDRRTLTVNINDNTDLFGIAHVFEELAKVLRNHEQRGLIIGVDGQALTRTDRKPR